MSDKQVTLDDLDEAADGASATTNGWQQIEMGELAEYQNGNAFSKSEWTDQGYPIIRIQNLTREQDDFNYFDGELEDRYRVENGDLLLSWSATIDVFEWDGPEAALNQHIYRVDTTDRVNEVFFRFKLEELLPHLEALSHGSTMKHVRKADLVNLDADIPPLEEQRKIASVLYNIDEAIQKTEEIISQVETVRTGFVQNLFEIEYSGDESENIQTEEERIDTILESRQKVWAEAEKERQQRAGNFDGSINEAKYNSPLDIATQRLPELPDGWLWTSLDTFVAYDIDYRGKTPPYSDSGVPVISSGNIQNGDIVFEDEKYVSEETYEDWLDRGVPKEGDILITTEAPVGKVALYPEGTYLPTRRIITCRTVGVENRYLQAAICHPYVQNYLTAQSGGSTVGRILKDHLLKTPIPLPPLDEQKQIAETLKEVDRRIINESAYKSRLQRLKQGLMQDLLSGTIRTTDTNIEVLDEVEQHG